MKRAKVLLLITVAVILMGSGGCAATRGSLWDAVKHDDVAMAHSILKRGGSTNVRDHYGDTPLHSAAMCGTGKMGKLAVAKVLIAYGADVTAKGDYGSTPLHYAALTNHVDVAEIFIAHGADVNARDDYGRTPLFRTSEFNSVDVAKLLIENGADVNAKDDHGLTVLRHNPDGQLAELLRQHGAKG